MSGTYIPPISLMLYHLEFSEAWAFKKKSRYLLSRKGINWTPLVPFSQTSLFRVNIFHAQILWNVQNRLYISIIYTIYSNNSTYSLFHFWFFLKFISAALVALDYVHVQIANQQCWVLAGHQNGAPEQQLRRKVVMARWSQRVAQLTLVFIRTLSIRSCKE